MTLKNRRWAMVFPGQGSQNVGMVRDLLSTELGLERAQTTRKKFSVDLVTLMQEGPREHLDQTTNTQPALFWVSAVLWDLWRALGGPEPAFLAGHSLGEYSACYASGMLDFWDGLELVKTRGFCMQQAVPEGTGAMAAVVGLDDAVLQKICETASQERWLYWRTLMR